jgi:chemotaxis methyl-accepting protein methylase
VIEARAAARMARLGMAPEAYLALLEAPRGASELGLLVEAVRVGETRLFRHRPQIEALVHAVAPALRGRASVRVWSAGCAAGEEVATLAVVLAAALPGSAVSILGTDVSADAIATARAGSYPAAALAQVPDERADWRAGFEQGADGRVRLRADLAASVAFERANLLDAAPGSAFDIVWCRNVLIYFTAAARRRAIERLVGATAVGGVVFVGYSESLRQIAELDAERCGEAVYYVKRGARREVSGRATAQRPVPVPVPVPDSALRSGESATGMGTGMGTGRELLVLDGHPDADEVAEALGAMLASHSLRALAIDLDGADLIGDELAPVLRRACAALRAAGVDVELRATRAGARRWLARHGLEVRA